MDVLGLLDAVLRRTPLKRSGSIKRKAAIKPKRRSAEHVAETSDIRSRVFHRAGYMCEAECWRAATDLDHQWSRRNGQSVETTWALCHAHHMEKTRNHPSRLHWLILYRQHAERHHYTAEIARAQAAIEYLAAKLKT